MKRREGCEEMRGADMKAKMETGKWGGRENERERQRQRQMKAKKGKIWVV